MMLLGNNVWLGYNDCLVSWLFNNHGCMWSNHWLNDNNGWSEDWFYHHNWVWIYNNHWFRLNNYNWSWLLYNDYAIVMGLFNNDYIIVMRLFHYYYWFWLLNNDYVIVMGLFNNYYIGVLLLLEHWLLSDNYFLDNIYVILGFNKEFSHKFLVMEDRDPFKDAIVVAKSHELNDTPSKDNTLEHFLVHNNKL